MKDVDQLADAGLNNPTIPPTSDWARLKLALTVNSRALSLNELQEITQISKSTLKRLLEKMRSMSWIVRLDMNTFIWRAYWSE